MNQSPDTNPSFGAPKKRVISKWLLITFICIVVIGAGFFTWFYLFGPGKKVATTATPAVTDPTANWKTYTNTTYGYSIKYPTDWQCTESSVTLKDSEGKAYLNSTNCKPITLKEDTLLGILVTDTTIDEVITEQKASFAQNSTFKEQGTATIGGQQATTLTWINNTDKSVIPVHYLISKNNNTYLISGQGSAGTNNSIIKQMINTIQFSTPIATTTTTPTQTASPITYTNGEFGFTFTMPATWEKYKIKTANYEGEVATLYIELPTTESSPASTINDEGYYSPFAIGVYTPEQWAAVQATGGPSGTVITQTDKYVFVWSQSNGVPPSDFDKSGDIKAIIDSFKTT